jgi:hypothetical protein
VEKFHSIGTRLCNMSPVDTVWRFFPTLNSAITPSACDVRRTNQVFCLDYSFPIRDFRIASGDAKILKCLSGKKYVITFCVCVCVCVCVCARVRACRYGVLHCVSVPGL